MQKENNEQVEQIKALECLRYHYPDIAHSIIHIANERKTSSYHGAILKRMGVKKGVSDLFVPKPRAGYHGLWIEVKKQNGVPSREQREFLDEVKSDGYAGFIAYGAQSIVDFVCDYFEVDKVKVL